GFMSWNTLANDGVSSQDPATAPGAQKCPPDGPTRRNPQMPFRLNRRRFLAGTAAGTAAAAIGMPAIAQGAPFKIGLLTVKTGPLAQGGIQMEQGISVLLKEKNNTLAGRKIEFISADTGGNPAGAKTKAQELIERDKVNVILGPLAAFELLAITDYVRDNTTPLISLAAAQDVTQRKANPFVIRPSATSGQCSHVIGDYAAKELKFKRVATISDDFASATSRCRHSSSCSGMTAERCSRSCGPRW